MIFTKISLLIFKQATGYILMVTENKSLDQFGLQSDEALSLTQTSITKNNDVSVPEKLVIGIAIANLNAEIETLNPEFILISETLAEDILNRPLQDFIPEHLREEMQQSLSSEQPWQREFVNYTQAGEMFWEKATLSMLYNHLGTVQQYSLTREDISDSKSIADKMLVLEQSLNDSLNEIYIFDAHNFYFLEVNQQACDNLGYNVEEFEELTPFDISPLVNQDEFKRLTQPLLENEQQKIIFTSLHYRKDGSIYPVEVHLQKISAETLCVFIAIVQDITERKEAEANLKKAKEKAEQSNQAKTQFLASMSHELRTPLNAILGFSQMMTSESNLTPQQRKNLQIINSSGAHLLTLINEVLDISKIEAGKVTLNVVDFDLVELLDEIPALFKEKCLNKNLQFNLKRQLENVSCIQADKTKLRQILINLIGNAIKFTHQGSITLRCYSKMVSENKVQLTFEVIDTGEGIEKKALAQVFDKFTQSESGKHAEEGTGLGLSISQRFVKLMGGEISLNSVVNQGTTFRFTIEVGNIKKNSCQKVIGIVPQQTLHKILIITPVKKNRPLLIALRTPLKFELREVDTIQKAIGLLHGWQPDLIFIDLNILEKQDFQTTQFLKAFHQDETLLIALTNSLFILQQKQHYFDGFLDSPFKNEALFDLLQQHLSLEFIYAEDDVVEIPETSNTSELTQEKLAHISSEIKTQLADAVQIVDVVSIEMLISKIAQQDSSLAELIQTQIDNFEYESLSLLLRA